MPTRLRVAACLAVTILPTYSAPFALQDRRAASPEGLALAQEADAAWNARDAARFSAVFSEDASFAFPVEGTFLRGRDEIRRHYARTFATLPPDLRHVSKLGTAENVAPTLSAADGEVDIVGNDPKTGKDNIVLRRYRTFTLAVRTGAGLRLRVVRVYPVSK